MPSLLQILLFGSLLAAFGFLLWWLLIPTEGVYLGRRVVVWLYDLYAHRYDHVKNYYREYEERYLAKPLMQRIHPHTAPLVLDVATGTGRLPLALVRYSGFAGRVIGLDFSRRMLRYAVRNLYPYDHLVDFIWSPAENLPFPDNTFDIVTCLEALEFMTNPSVVLAELTRVLRTGGLLLVTQRINTQWMPGKIWSKERFEQELASAGLVGVSIQGWQTDYRKVWSYKSGPFSPANFQPVFDHLRCPSCHQPLQLVGSQWLCETHRSGFKRAQDRVLEPFKA